MMRSYSLGSRIQSAILCGELFDHDPCSEKDDRLLCRKHYKIIVASATDRRDLLLYY
jgi:hypothetical protein